MTEFWQSKKQYWCKFCSIFIRDDAPSRSLHENGLKHQGNKERALRQLYKTGEQAKRDKENERKMMERIEREAMSAHRAAGGTGPPPIASSSSASSSRRGPAKAADPYANYSTAASLGYGDADAAWVAEQAAIREKAEKQGNVGRWETVVPVVASPSPPVDAKPDEAAEGEGAAEQKSKSEELGPGEIKPALRTLRGTLDEPDSAEAHNFRFGETARRLPDEDLADDLDALEARIRARAGKAPEVPAYQSGGFVKAEMDGGVEEGAAEDGAATTAETSAVKAEDGEAKPDVKPEVDGEDVKPAGGGMFKKRKAPGGANRSVRQKV